MAIKVQDFNDERALLDAMTALPEDGHTIIFRGQPNSIFKLSSSFAREYDQSHYDFLQRNIVELLNNYKVTLIRAGIVPFQSHDLFDWMEYGRHYGLPTPSIDFTNSPYIGLFFAFDGIGQSRLRNPKADDKIAIYALDLQILAYKLALSPSNPVNGPSAWWLSVLNADPRVFPIADSTADEVVRRVRGFLEPDYDRFKKTIPLRTLQTVPFPGSKVERIHRQQGLLIYDTLYYKPGKLFEDLLEACPNDDDGKPVAYKFTLPASCASNVWKLLSEMGITPSSMYLDTASAVRDAMQQRYYLSNLTYLRDDERFEAGDDFEPDH